MVELGVDPDKVVVKHNGVNGDLFCVRDKKALRTKLDLPADAAIICYVGNLVAEKGVDVLVEAMQYVRRSSGRSYFQVVLVGGGGPR